MNAFKDQILASTHLDAHGERTPVEVLRKLCVPAGKRLSLRHQHDYGRPPIGFIENTRVVEDPETPGEWLLLGDAYIVQDDIVEALGGFSYSITEEFAGNMSCDYAAIYLPYPHYNDQAFVTSLQDTDSRLTVGRLRQKTIAPSTALLVTAVLWFFRPAWQDVYDTILKPRIRSLLALVPRLREKGIEPNFAQRVQGPKGESVRVMFFPDDGQPPREQEILRGLVDVDRYFSEHPDHRQTEQVSLHRLGEAGAYMITHVEFTDGTDVYVA